MLNLAFILINLAKIRIQVECTCLIKHHAVREIGEMEVIVPRIHSSARVGGYLDAIGYLTAGDRTPVSY